MAVALIFISLIASIAVFALQAKGSENSLRIAFLQGLIVHGCIIVVSTEGLSLSRSLDFIHITTLWLISILIHSFILYQIYQASLIVNHSRSQLIQKLRNFWVWLGKQAMGQLKRWVIYFKGLDTVSQFSILITITIIVVSLMIGLIAAPNNWDAMTYHQARVMHWVQNHTVAQYPTHNLRQISLPPGAAYIVTHLQILAGSDRFASCVQWLAFVGSIIGISLLTNNLVGASAQWISMLLCASLPMVILQSMTTQVDLVMSFWLVCFTYFSFSFQLSKLQRYVISDLFFLTVSLGLAVVTKPTAIIFGTPLLFVFALRVFKDTLTQSQHYLSAFFAASSIVLGVTIAACTFSIPTWIRNTYTFGEFLGIDIGTRSKVVSLSDFLSVALKNLGLNLTVPGYAEVVIFLHKYLLQTDLDQAALTYGDPAIPFNHPLASSTTLLFPFEDTVASPIHLILFIISSLYISYLFTNKNRRPVNQKLYLLTAAIWGGYGLYSYLLKWQPWGNRLLMTLFILQTPIIAAYITCSLKQKNAWQRHLLSLIALIALVYALTPLRRPLIPWPIESVYLKQHQSASILTLTRQQIYYSGSLKYLEMTHNNIVRSVVDRYHCHTIGLISGEDDWEYPLWVLFNQATAGNFRLKHVQINNASARLKPEFPDDEICAIVSSHGRIQAVAPNSSISR